MFKNLIRIFLFFIIILIIFVTYLSIFGIKTDKFNEIIKSQIIKQDKRFDIIINDVFIKLNLKERSFSLNSKDVQLFILKENHEISNIVVLLDLRSLLLQDNKVKKIIINSNENEIVGLLNFIKAYKVNIPVLYLKNSISKGKIVYDLVLNFKNNKLNQVKISGKIKNAEVKILGNNKLENTNLDFVYTNGNLDILDLNFKLKNTKFNSKKISITDQDKSIELIGSFKNNLNLNLLLNLLENDYKNYFNDDVLLIANSNFNVLLNKKYKVQNYILKSNINFDDLKINIKNAKLKKIIPDFEDKLILNKGSLDLEVNSKKPTYISINSKYILNEKMKSRDISLNISKKKSTEKYEFYIDLKGNEIIVDELNFKKKRDEDFYVKLTAENNLKYFEITKFKAFNNKNLFDFKNIKFVDDYKIKDFNLIEAKYFNQDNFLNDILISKKKNQIMVNSKNIDLSSNIEKSLKSTDTGSFFDIFQNLNSTIKIKIVSAKLDDDHFLKNFAGYLNIKKNKIHKSKLEGKFSDQNNFTFTKDKVEGKRFTTIYSDLAKPFVKKFNFIKGFEGGKLDYTSTEISEDLSKSELRLYDFKLQDMPTLTKLLSLASLQGIADLATGEGIRFNEFDMFFENSKKLITINEIYALGPAISVLMEGYVEKEKIVSLRGTLVPATTINKTIAKIPLLGNILVGEKIGEGVFGVSFKIKGPPDNLDTRVNPIKTLTPRFITRTLDKIKKSN